MPTPDPLRDPPASAATEPRRQGNPSGSSDMISFPGVFLEETGQSVKSIPGVNTSTSAFVGPTHMGPVNVPSEAITSLGGFEAVYGKGSDDSSGQNVPSNFLWGAARAFFENGGLRLYVARTAAGRSDGQSDPQQYRAALCTIEALKDVAIVAAPGGGSASLAEASAIHAELIAHASRPGACRFAILDPPQGCSISDVQALRRQLNSDFAALYYPWIGVANPRVPPTRRAAINFPPSGFLAGIYARVDAQQGVFKAPANIAPIGAASLERTLTETDANTLNSAGINTLRAFPGRSILVWGARTLSSNSDWKYVNVRRLFNYLEHSIQQGTQWVVFEPNGEDLWARVRDTIRNFLYSQWSTGALMGNKPEDAFFMKCDRTTMSQNDLDNGRLVCIVGVAPIKPAEFVIFRIGQWTADATKP